MHERGFATLLDGDGMPVEPLTHDLDDSRPGLRLLPAGGGDGHHLVDPAAAEGVTARLLEHADVVIYHAPAMSSYADALALAHSADAVLVALRFGRTRRDQLEQALDVFATVGIEVTGLVVALRTRGPWARRRL
jgi:Mrp family chromosome partitioning ATPase